MRNNHSIASHIPNGFFAGFGYVLRRKRRLPAVYRKGMKRTGRMQEPLRQIVIRFVAAAEYRDCRSGKVLHNLFRYRQRFSDNSGKIRVYRVG